MGRLLLRIHLDGPLLALIAALLALGMLVLYSAVGQDLDALSGQLLRAVLALGIMVVLAQVDPAWLRRLSPWIYGLGIIMLTLVLITGEIGKGAQRWLDIGVTVTSSNRFRKCLHNDLMATLL